ncbi:hypothetical protein DNTS_025374 [Danionella cerebrum]|uniref:rhomboid protease n=1 Tax=Danionella cerebrum TaxID=2873325 RepID=A0A553QIS2_9TELE|nr:hypothetical protein DNTS_025374 [Danionella translucida]
MDGMEEEKTGRVFQRKEGNEEKDYGWAENEMDERKGMVETAKSKQHQKLLEEKKTQLSIHPQQRCGFRRAQRETETKRGNQGTKGEAESPQPEAPLPSKKAENLLKPLLFTVGFTGCSFGAAAILQYESVKSKVQSAMNAVKDKRRDSLEGHSESYWHNWWGQLTSFQRQAIMILSELGGFWSRLSEGQKTVAGLIALNTVVLCCWRIPSMQRFLVKYFVSDPASKTRCLPMILSTFSHYSVFHLVANMYVLWSFSTSIVSILGREQFLALYLSGGVISSFVSYISKTATGRLGPSLGASGSIMTILAAVCTKMPEAKLGIIFLPVFTFTAGNALKALAAFDMTGLLLGWKLLDHASHLGGLLFGVWYIKYGNDLIWKNREPLVKFWHELRNGSFGGPRPGGG